MLFCPAASSPPNACFSLLPQGKLLAHQALFKDCSQHGLRCFFVGDSSMSAEQVIEVQARKQWDEAGHPGWTLGPPYHFHPPDPQQAPFQHPHQPNLQEPHQSTPQHPQQGPLQQSPCTAADLHANQLQQEPRVRLAPMVNICEPQSQAAAASTVAASVPSPAADTLAVPADVPSQAANILTTSSPVPRDQHTSARFSLGALDPQALHLLQQMRQQLPEGERRLHPSQLVLH